LSARRKRDALAVRADANLQNEKDIAMLRLTSSLLRRADSNTATKARRSTVGSFYRRPSAPEHLEPRIAMYGQGIVQTDVTSGFNESGTGIRMQADGRLVAVGAGPVSEANGLDVAVVRYNANGSLDSTFSGDGMLTTDLGSSLDIFWGGMAIQNDQKIVAAGKKHTIGSDPATMAVVRYLPDGSLDTTFDGDGKVFTPFGGISSGEAVAIDSDEKIVVAGRADRDVDYASSRPVIVRYNPDGSLDTSWGGTGIVITDFGLDWVQSYSDLAIQSDGKLVAAGAGDSMDGNGTRTHYRFLARYNPDGTLDSSFDGDGKILVSSGTSDSHFITIVLQPDGKILAAGSEPGGTGYVARFNSDGSLDASFGDSGEVHRTDLPSINGVALQSDGKIILAASNGFWASPDNSWSLKQEGLLRGSSC
jgi:uncharacterized delta-60 repeat protein